MTIERLTEANEAVLLDINVLLKQLRKDPPNHGTLDELRAVVESDKHRLFVVRDGDKIIGMATLYIMQKIGKRTGHVEDVVVDSAYRGQGLGEKLMHEIIAVAKAERITTLFLTSRPARVAAHKLYQKVGFTVKDTTVFRLSL